MSGRKLNKQVSEISNSLGQNGQDRRNQQKLKMMRISGHTRPATFRVAGPHVLQMMEAPVALLLHGRRVMLGRRLIGRMLIGRMVTSMPSLIMMLIRIPARPTP